MSKTVVSLGFSLLVFYIALSITHAGPPVSGYQQTSAASLSKAPVGSYSRTNRFGQIESASSLGNAPVGLYGKRSYAFSPVFGFPPNFIRGFPYAPIIVPPYYGQYRIIPSYESEPYAYPIYPINDRKPPDDSPGRHHTTDSPTVTPMSRRSGRPRLLGGLSGLLGGIL